METLISENSICFFDRRLPASTLLFPFSSLPQKNQKSIHLSLRKFVPSRTNGSIHCLLAAASSPNSVNFSGWDDPRLSLDSVQAGESLKFQDFLVSIGIDDRKHVFMFLMGFVCALAISRVRVSSIIVFPAFVIVFSVGISIGFVNGRRVGLISSSQAKKSSGEIKFRFSSEKFKLLSGFFDGLDRNVNDLRNRMDNALASQSMTESELGSYVKVMESIRFSSVSARKVLEDSTNAEGTSDNVVESNGALDYNQKQNNNRKEIDRSGFDLLNFLGGLFGENMFSSNTTNAVKFHKQEFVQTNVYRSNKEKTNEPVPNSAIGSILTDIPEFLQPTSNKAALDQFVEKNLDDSSRRIRLVRESGNSDLEEASGSATRSLRSKKYDYVQDRSLSMTERKLSKEMDHQNDMKTYSSLFDSVDFSVSMKHTEMEASFGQEEIFKNSNGAWMPDSRDKATGNYRPSMGQESVSVDGPQSTDDSYLGSSEPSMLSDDAIFDSYLAEANSLLRNARECLRVGRVDEKHANVLLYKSSDALSRAVSMKPMNLLAVGQLGNAYLLHGELKLKISRKLRSQLYRSNLSFSESQRFKVGEVRGRDSIVSNLSNVCEECEELLVEAGRKYRMALSIDGNDVRALYNWGLALSFRAQLISDIGPEAASDADKVFLAAIDKFDAIMSKGNTYAPDALFRWGMALQQRSRLRPQSSREKVKLLQQARRLYEDALRMDSSRFLVREALSSCISELNIR